MKFILDSSVAVRWVLVEPYSDKANLLRDDYRNAIHELLSPDVFPVEVMHALTKAERQKRISANQGGILWADVMATCPKLVPYLPLIPRAYDIASQLRIGPVLTLPGNPADHRIPAIPASCDSVGFKRFRHEETAIRWAFAPSLFSKKSNDRCKKQTCRGKNTRWSPSFREAWALI